jgi:hypothetical protein
MRRATQVTGKRAFSSSSGGSRFGWKTGLGVVAVGSFGAYKMSGSVLYPAVDDEIVHDLMLADTTVEKVSTPSSSPRHSTPLNY